MLDRLKTLPEFVALATDPGDEAERARGALALIEQQAPEVYEALLARWRAHDAAQARVITQLRRRVARSVVVAVVVVAASTAVCSAVIFAAVGLALQLAGVAATAEVSGERQPTAHWWPLVVSGVVVIAAVAGWLGRGYLPFLISGELGELSEQQQLRAQPEPGRRATFMLHDVTMLLRSVRP